MCARANQAWPACLQGDYVYADKDGILVSGEELTL